MFDFQRTNARAVSFRGELLAGTSAVVFSLAVLATPAVAQQIEQTPYGTARNYLAVGISTNHEVSCPTFSSNRAFLQWAGITAGISESFYDFYCSPASQPFVFAEGGSATQYTYYKINYALSGPVFAPITPDAVTPENASAGKTGFIFGGGASFPIMGWPMISGPTWSLQEPMRYAPEDKPASGFPSVLPTKAPPPKPSAPPRFITLNAEVGIYGFAGGKSTLNGIPGGPGITPGGADSFNFRDNFMVTAGGAIVVPVTASLTAAVTGGFTGIDKTVTFNCVTYCQFPGAPVPTFSDSKDVFLPGAYVGGRLQWPIGIFGFPGANLILQYKHVFAFGENVSLGSVAQGRIVGFNVAQDLDLVTAGLSIPLGGK
jgi:hypothetical protein